MSRFDRASRARLLVDVTLDVDPASGTVEISLDGGAWVPATWQAAAVHRKVYEPGSGRTVDKWDRTARTSAYFAGPDATPAGATVLALGRHQLRARTVVDGDTVVAQANPIDVA